MALVESLTKAQVMARLEDRRAGRRFTVFHEEVLRLTGMDISYHHLFNIVRGHREPNDVVMKYLGGSVVERPVEYQVKKPETSPKRKSEK